MPNRFSAKSDHWLALRDASKQLGVSPATLRQWADQGKVQSFRTPGGHRRFSMSGIHSMVGDQTPPPSDRRMETLIHSALGRARLEIAAGRLEGEPWHRTISSAMRERHRQLGQQLMTLLLGVLRSESNDANLVNRVHQIGKEYARINLQQGASLTDTMRAFLFFRDYIFEDLVELAVQAHQETNSNVLATYRRLSHFVNEMLLAMIENYTKEKSRK
jgi:excisionase family DNA binding protein